MKIRYLTLLTALIFLGFTVSAYAIKPGNNYPKYNYEIDGGTSGFLQGVGSGWIWNGTQVGSTYADGRTFPLEMSYITDDDEVGTECFLSTVYMGGFFKKQKKSTAVGMFWFPGKTRASAGDQKNVLYLLMIEGHFGIVYDPTGFPGNGKIMYMTHWTLSVENQGKRVKSRSCEGSGIFGSGTGNDFVKVTFEGPN